MERIRQYYPALFLLVLFTLIISGCGPNRVNLKILRPAVINVESVKKIAVLDFLTTNDIDKTIGMEIASRLTSKLVQNGHFKIIERKELKSILDEQGLAITGAVDTSKVQEIGKLIGADALIIGTLNTYNHNDNIKNDTIFNVYRAERVATVDVTFSITDVKTGLIIASKTDSQNTRKSVHRSYEQETKEDKLIGLAAGILTQKNAESPEDKARKDALKSLPDPTTMLNRVVDEILDSFVVQIAPHYIIEKRIVESGSNIKMKNAIKFVERDMWEDAPELSK